jgi:hypothetical protein
VREIEAAWTGDLAGWKRRRAAVLLYG